MSGIAPNRKIEFLQTTISKGDIFCPSIHAKEAEEDCKTLLLKSMILIKIKLKIKRLRMNLKEKIDKLADLKTAHPHSMMT
jgi:hypothetical protein